MQNEMQTQSNMNCTKNPERPAAGICSYSGKPYSSEELVEVRGKMYARDNLPLVMDELKTQADRNQQPMVFMNAGGAAASSSATVNGVPSFSATSKTSAALMCFFLGGLGVHRFATGHVISGLVMLFSALFGWLLFYVPTVFVCLWLLVDLFRILTGSFRDKQGLALK